MSDAPKTLEDVRKLTVEQYAEHRDAARRILAGKKPFGTGPIRDEAELKRVSADLEEYRARRPEVMEYLTGRKDRLAQEAAAKAAQAQQGTYVPPPAEPKGRELPRFSTDRQGGGDSDGT